MTTAAPRAPQAADLDRLAIDTIRTLCHEPSPSS